MNKLWLAACFALGISAADVSNVSVSNISVDLIDSKCYAQDDYYNKRMKIMEMLDENWGYGDMDDYWFFPLMNLAIQRNPKRFEKRNGNWQYDVNLFRPRAMNGTAEVLLYQFAVSGKTDREEKHKRRSAKDRFEHLKFYAELNGFTIEEVIGGKDLITIGSSSDAVVARYVPFPIGEVPVGGITSIKTDSGMLYRHIMDCYYAKDQLFLQSAMAGDDSVQFHYIEGRDYEWYEFKPYEGHGKSQSSQSLKERILGKWNIVKATDLSGNPEDLEGCISTLTFFQNGKWADNEESGGTYEIINKDKIHLKEGGYYDEVCDVSFKADTFIIKDSSALIYMVK